MNKNRSLSEEMKAKMIAYKTETLGITERGSL